jgi:hypothetical protein
MRLLGIVLALVASCFADTVTLKNGQTVAGTYLGGTARQVRMDAGDRIQTIDVSDILRIEFTTGPSASVTPAPPRPLARAAEPDDRPVLRRSESGILRPDPVPANRPPAAAGALELPSGTNVVVRMIDGVDSETARPGQNFAASVDEAVMVNGETLIPRGADAVLKLVDAKESGKLTGRAELTLDLVSVMVNGKPLELNTITVSRVSDSRGERTAKVAGGTAVVGAIIGGIAAGGKGAALGAAAGGAAGAGAEIITKGQQVKIPSETRLTFVLDTPVRL